MLSQACRGVLKEGSRNSEGLPQHNGEGPKQVGRRCWRSSLFPQGSWLPLLPGQQPRVLQGPRHRTTPLNCPHPTRSQEPGLQPNQRSNFASEGALVPLSRRRLLPGHCSQHCGEPPALQGCAAAEIFATCIFNWIFPRWIDTCTHTEMIMLNNHLTGHRLTSPFTDTCRTYSFYSNNRSR